MILSPVSVVPTSDPLPLFVLLNVISLEYSDVCGSPSPGLTVTVFLVWSAVMVPSLSVTPLPVSV